MQINFDQSLALVLVPLALFEARWALKVSTAPPSVRMGRLLSALATVLCAVLLLMPTFSIGWLLAFIAMLCTNIAALRVLAHWPSRKTLPGQS
jgi:hypothetical protein